MMKDNFTIYLLSVKLASILALFFSQYTLKLLIPGNGGSHEHVILEEICKIFLTLGQIFTILSTSFNFLGAH